MNNCHFIASDEVAVSRYVKIKVTRDLNQTVGLQQQPTHIGFAGTFLNRSKLLSRQMVPTYLPKITGA